MNPSAILRWFFPKIIGRTYANCPKPEPKFVDEIKVTILGRLNPSGRVLALLLKQCEGLDELRLYGMSDYVCATATDICSIDTNTLVRGYKGGSQLLRKAVEGSNIIIICGGEPQRLSETKKTLFSANLDAVKHYAIHIAEFNPNAIVLVATPPINSFVPLICEELKKAGHFDSRKVIGMSNIMGIRANSCIAKHLDADPTHYLCPIVGGCSSETMVPVFSQTTPAFELEDEKADIMHDEIANAEKHTLEKKYIQNLDSCYISPAFAITRFVNSLIKAMKGNDESIECGFIRQTNHIDSFLPYMSSVVKLGPSGVAASYMPKLNTRETRELKKVYPILKRDIEVGISCITGDIFRKGDRSCELPSDYCSTLNRSQIEIVGDVVVDWSKKFRNFKIIS